jgi:late competence protein required for DNA uptake (superfamily II DNA/RNA helicase)
MMEYARRNMKILTLVDPDVTWIRETVDNLREKLENKLKNWLKQRSIAQILD